MMKKLLLLFTIVLVPALAGCGDDAGKEVESKAGKEVEPKKEVVVSGETVALSNTDFNSLKDAVNAVVGGAGGCGGSSKADPTQLKEFFSKIEIKIGEEFSIKYVQDESNQWKFAYKNGQCNSMESISIKESFKSK
jgi:hypothetical protein